MTFFSQQNQYCIVNFKRPLFDYKKSLTNVHEQKNDQPLTYRSCRCLYIFHIILNQCTKYDFHPPFQISIYYPSGKRTKFIKNENFRTVCRAIVDTENADTIINALITDHSDAVIKGASKIISKEASQICKKKSGSCLQGSSCNEIMEFSWNKLKDELVIRAPGILKIISAIVSDIPSSLTDNRLRHVLQSAVIAFHGRSREMSTLQYIVCMIQAHGGCTNRVSIFNLSKWIKKFHNQAIA